MANGEVASLIGEAGGPADAAEAATVVGHDPVLPSRFPIGEAAAIALAATGSMAARIWSERTGNDAGQTVTVQVERAATSLLSFVHQRVEPGTETAATPEARLDTRALVALYPCRDGRWIHLHGAFPHLAERTSRVLGCGDDPDAGSVAKAVAQWDAFDLEDALAEVKTCGAAVRTTDEWRLLPQGRAVAGMARVEVERIGDAEPEPVGDGRRPLGGVRVLDLTRVLAGPTHARVLAEHGADALLVNSPNLPNAPAFVMDTSHGKLSTFLDLDDPDDAATLRQLVATADVFGQGYRGGALERRGLGPEQLAEARPGIVYVTINCYGDTGPWRERPGWEQLAQSVTGLAAAQGEPDRPTLMPAAACDYTTGYLAALGTMVALWRRSHEGGSWHVRASLCQTGNWLADLGPTCDPAAASSPSADDLDRWRVTTDTPFGRLRHLGPVAELPATPPHWTRPTVPLGTHEPAWP